MIYSMSDIAFHRKKLVDRRYSVIFVIVNVLPHKNLLL